MLKPEDAWKAIESNLAPPTPDFRPRRSAMGAVLSKDLLATLNVPAQDVSAMDGYVVSDPPEPGAKIPVAFTVAAGDAPGAQLAPNSAARIMTGAPTPSGSERVIPIENTDGGDEMVAVLEPGAESQHIRRKGEVTQTGDVILSAGSVVTPSTLGLIATHGYSEVEVFSRPSVAYMTGGDEVISPESKPKPGQLRDSHSDFFFGACAQLGLETSSLGIVRDRVQDLEAAVQKGMSHDVLLMSGGVSMGEFDFVEQVLRNLGCDILFESVAIQPGKPMVAARHANGWIFGLPGNPASAMVTFWLLVRPALRRMMGFPDSYWQGALRGRLTSPLPRAKGRDLFLPARCIFEDGEILLQPAVPAGSHDVGAYGLGTALIRIPARSQASPAGTICSFLPLVEWQDAVVT